MCRSAPLVSRSASLARPVVPLRPQEERRTGGEARGAASRRPAPQGRAPGAGPRAVAGSYGGTSRLDANLMGAWCRLADQDTGVLRRGERLASEGRGPVKRVMTGPATASRRT